MIIRALMILRDLDSQNNLSFAIRSSRCEPQSAPDLVFAECIQRLHFQLQRILSTWFQCWPFGDVHVYNHLSCWKRVFSMTIMLSWPNSFSLCPTSFYIPRPKLPVTPGISSLPPFTFNSPLMKNTSFLGVSSRRSCSSSWTIQLHLLWHYWLGHWLGLLWCWMVCLGNNQDYSVIFKTAP